MTNKRTVVFYKRHHESNTKLENGMYRRHATLTAARHPLFSTAAG